MKKSIKDMSASVRGRLLNLAKSTGRDFQEITIRYAVERFLARLAESEHRDRFILKGAMLYIPWKLDDKRTTMDLDLLGFGSPDRDNLILVFRAICEVEIEDDGLRFDGKSVTARAIREEAIYDGVRMMVNVALGAMRIRLQVDVGFGDHIVPEPECSEFPALLAEHGPVVRVYSPETVIAEKFHAMAVLGMANSRMKDYFDIWMLSRNFTINGAILGAAIEQTFAKRQTSLPKTEPTGLSEEFSSNEQKQRQWDGFLRRQRRLDSAPGLPVIVEANRGFLVPIVTSIATDEEFKLTWSPDQGWK